jgi:sugar-specific transcriptional regulator TrmB
VDGIESLEKAGLTQNEAKIYYFLLREKSATVTEIAKRTGIHRRSAYDVLMRLSDKALVSYMVDEGTKKYFPSNPGRINEIIEEKKKMFSEALPGLKEMFAQRAGKKSTQFFMGKKGIRAVLDEQLEIGEEILVLGASAGASDIIREYFPRYHLIRAKSKIPMRIIYSGKKHHKTEKLALVKAKAMPEDTGGDVAINIYGDHVAMVMWNLDSPFVILIKQKEVADSFRDYFEFIWGKL